VRVRIGQPAEVLLAPGETGEGVGCICAAINAAKRAIKE
jgi:hypothetical protein